MSDIQICLSRKRAAYYACARSPAYFLDHYASIYDAGSRDWTRFALWPAQVTALDAIESSHRTIILKARQVGMSWLCAGYALWLMLFRPSATVLLFSRRDEEAVHLLNFRLRGMLEHLPESLVPAPPARDSAHELRLANGSVALAFPTTGGRSYSATLAVVDEADHVGDLDALLNAVKPTVDTGGQLVLLSTADKRRPESAFKRIYRAAERGSNDWTPVFLPWHAHPDRSPGWYAAQEADIRARTGSLDDLHQEYPADAFEALAPRSQDKFFPEEWLAACWSAEGEDGDMGADAAAPAIPGLRIHHAPEAGSRYVVGADPAEGNPHSDESAAVVLDGATGEQVATLGRRCDPALFAAHLDAVGRYYNDADLLVERNNHGHAVLLWLREFSPLTVLRGRDGQPGWAMTGASKPLAFDVAARTLRDRGVTLRDEQTLYQLAAVDGATLAAPPGQHDDRAIACVLAINALERSAGEVYQTVTIPPAPL
jgi:hypothetical protein